MANEAGQGATDRGSNSTAFTYISKATASQSGNCTRLAVYAEAAGSTAIKFAFFTMAGAVSTRVTDVFTFGTGAGGNQVYEFNSGADFVAFVVTSGWYLGCWVAGNQTYQTTGGVGFGIMMVM